MRIHRKPYPNLTLSRHLCAVEMGSARKGLERGGLDRARGEEYLCFCGAGTIFDGSMMETRNFRRRWL